MSLYHQIALTFVPGIGDITARALISHFENAEAVFEASRADLISVPGIRKNMVEAILNKDGFERAEKELLFVEKYKIKALFWADSDYPKRLKNCYDAPVLLYYKGNANLNTTKIISIVGTRKSTAYGKELTSELVEELKKHEVLVISGLAHGIDGIAHKACIKNEIQTVGVLGHGLDRIYPAQHRALAEKMVGMGGLLTEFPSETNPDRENFPKRNRIVAGLADATIIVEANIKGGALITAELANSYNRDVFAFPGRVTDEFSSGCNYLIKTNRAHLISGIKDLEYLLGWNTNLERKREKQISLNLNLTVEEKLVFDVLNEKGQTAVDDLALLTNLPQSKLAVTVLGLEMQGIVVSLPGKTYKLI
ncbi:DNA-processing protein DprA [Rubrolithibacter danxiaensis]|uniref:DNA-processing protein DprA n=1 Tax=Rubrolithibacter danxiaensis TaxID=3390805 RepID=UPI003BF88AB1